MQRPVSFSTYVFRLTSVMHICFVCSLEQFQFGILTLSPVRYTQTLLLRFDPTQVIVVVNLTARGCTPFYKPY